MTELVMSPHAVVMMRLESQMTSVEDLSLGTSYSPATRLVGMYEGQCLYETSGVDKT